MKSFNDYNVSFTETENGFLKKLKILSDLHSDMQLTLMIYIGEGAIPLIEAGANKYCYTNKPNIQIFNQIMSDMSDKAQSDTGNHYAFVVNRKLWNDINLVLGDYLANYRTDGTYLYSKSANKGQGGYVKVGSTFDSYEYAFSN